MAAASENMRFVSAVTAFGLLMKQSEYKGTAKKQMVLDLANGAITFDPHEYRKSFVDIIKKWNE